MKSIFSFAATCCLMLCIACGPTTTDTNSTDNTNSETTDPKTTDSNASDHTTPTTPETTPTNDKVLAWVDNLNIRDQPNIKSKVVAKVKENDPLTLTGKKTDFTETISLRGTSYTEPWVQVTTKSGETGWVFQGATKRLGEDKGNALNTKQQFSYPHFGTFDLSTWKKMPDRDDSSDELDVTTSIYKKENRILEISTNSMGEFYWGKDFKLFDNNKQLLKQRSISISSDSESGSQLEELVKDFSSNAPMEYVRSQKLKKHFSQINPKPDMAKGVWNSTAIKGEKTSSIYNSEGYSAKGVLGTFSPGDCDKMVFSDDTGCACSFSTGDPYKGPTIFYSNMDQYACVKINNQMNALYLGKDDFKKELPKMAQSKYWISIQKTGPVLYFGKPLEQYGYSDGKELLTDVILASGKTYTEIPIENKSEGMAIREIKDLTTDAIAYAAKLKSTGFSDSMNYLSYDNRTFDVIVRTRRTTNYEGEANQYEGQIFLISNDKKTVLDTKNIKGNCGC